MAVSRARIVLSSSLTTRPVETNVLGMRRETPTPEKAEPEAYEKPRIVDYGDLAELTAGGTELMGMDQLWPNSVKAKKGFPFS